jgi:ParB family chromosome partitioning protein
VAAGVLSAGHARALLGLQDSSDIERLAARIVAEGLSVRSVEEIVAVGAAGTRKTAKPGKKSSGKLSAPGLAELSGRLSDRLDTRVTVSVGRSKGKVVVEFATLDDLQRIVDIIAPVPRGVFGEPVS